jgi:hypothetical protein
MPYKDPEKQKTYQRAWRQKWIKIKANREKVRKRRSDTTQYLRNIKAESGCKICGEKDPVVLLFHHRNPKKKSFGVGECSMKNKELIKKEIKKCDILCSNCHLRLHEKERIHNA